MKLWNTLAPSDLLLVALLSLFGAVAFVVAAG